ncbi:MAG: DUF3253 domain-containing protein [Sandaracinaceae bacterium]|nr:DUF3253 domain-containing protein [Sandaracinaceae bacterium]
MQEQADEQQAASDIEEAIARTILRLLAKRKEGASICPSEVARAVAGGECQNAWRSLMGCTRAVATRLAREGIVEITQKGIRVDPEKVQGPIRIRLRAKSEDI